MKRTTDLMEMKATIWKAKMVILQQLIEEEVPDLKRNRSTRRK